MDPMLEKLFRDTAGQALLKEALATGIKMPIGRGTMRLGGSGSSHSP